MLPSVQPCKFEEGNILAWLFLLMLWEIGNLIISEPHPEVCSPGIGLVLDYV